MALKADSQVGVCDDSYNGVNGVNWQVNAGPRKKRPFPSPQPTVLAEEKYTPSPVRNLVLAGPTLRLEAILLPPLCLSAPDEPPVEG